MLNDNFRTRYKTIPFAVSIQENCNISTTLHNHMEFEIILMKEGEALVFVNGEKYEMSAGDMMFINPMEIHSVEKKDFCSLHCICFDISLISDEKTAEEIKSEKLHIKNLIEKDNQYSYNLKNYFESIMRVHIEDKMYSDMEIKAFLSLIFAELLKNNFTVTGIGKSKKTLFCSEVIAYIAENYAEKITSSDVALALSYTQSYFCRNFKKNFGKCFSEYLNIYRISMSRKFLEEEKMSITEIAHRCGFSSNVYFTKSFKAYVGISPSKYKNS